MIKIQARHTRLLQMGVRYSLLSEITEVTCNLVSQIFFRLKGKQQSGAKLVWWQIKGGMSYWDTVPAILIKEEDFSYLHGILGGGRL